MSAWRTAAARRSLMEAGIDRVASASERDDCNAAVGSPTRAKTAHQMRGKHGSKASLTIHG